MTYLIFWSKASIATEPPRESPEIRDSSKEKNKLQNKAHVGHIEAVLETII